MEDEDMRAFNTDVCLGLEGEHAGIDSRRRFKVQGREQAKFLTARAEKLLFHELCFGVPPNQEHGQFKQTSCQGAG